MGITITDPPASPPANSNSSNFEDVWHKNIYSNCQKYSNR